MAYAVVLEPKIVGPGLVQKSWGSQRVSTCEALWHETASLGVITHYTLRPTVTSQSMS